MMTNAEVVRSAYDAFLRGDIQRVLSTFASNITWFVPGGPEIPFAGRVQGNDQVAEFFQRLDASLEFQEFKPEHFVEQGDTVVVLGRSRVRVKATGSIVQHEWAHVMTVRDDVITDFYEYADMTEITAAFRQAAARVA